MQTAPREIGGLSLGSPSIRRAVVAALVLAFAVVVAIGVVDAVRRLGSLDHRRDEAIAARGDTAGQAGNVAGALRRFRSDVAAGDRFALVFAPDLDRNQQGFYRLVALSYLYPAVAVSDPGKADAIMVFGTPTPSMRETFGEIAVVDGVWLGRRGRE